VRNFAERGDSHRAEAEVFALTVQRRTPRGSDHISKFALSEIARVPYVPLPGPLPWVAARAARLTSGYFRSGRGRSGGGIVRLGPADG
jgi:hypothetical protein